MAKTDATIAIGGFQHETNTFAPVAAHYEDFVKADGWPPLGRGADMFREIDGVHLPITGAYDFLRDKVRCVPLLWASAVPSAHVSEEAFETIAAMFIEDLTAAKNSLDGVYLDLHGAMVCDHLQDGEGELLKRIRAVIGDMPLAISLDLHANITPEMVALCDYIDIFRTYPHIDMAATGERAAQVLLDIINGAMRLKKAFRQADFIIPLCDGCTFFGASQKFYDEDLTEILQNGDAIRASAACGFPLADIHHIGPSVLAYAEAQDKADKYADELIARMQKRFSGNTETYFEAPQAVREAQTALAELGSPIIIADVQDNAGGGGTGDTTGMIRALMESSVKSAVVACVYDPETAADLARRKIGDKVKINLGGKKFADDSPYICEAEILALEDGVFTGTGPMWKGARMRLGPMALIAVGNIRIILQSQNQQAADCAILRHVGIEPSEEEIIILKSSVHYRADFQPIAKKIISAKAPGAVYADISDLPYKHIRSGLRLVP